MGQDESLQNMSNMQQILSNVTNIQKQLENKQFINRMGGDNFVGFMNNPQRIPQEQFEDMGNLSGLINDPMSAGLNPGELGPNEEN